MAEKYYIQDTRQVVGNCAVWWKPEGAGYTCDLRKAGLFDKDRVPTGADHHIVRRKEYIDSLAELHVDTQMLEKG